MEIDFRPKKVWQDLQESKESLKYLYFITLFMMFLSIIDVVLKVRIFSHIGNIVLGGYLVLMVNNIIHDKKTILENLKETGSKERNLFLIILKIFGIGLIYSFVLGLVAFTLYLVFSKLLMLNTVQTASLIVLFLIPLLVILFFSNLLFSENLAFKDAFNVKRACRSFKVAWGKYLQIFGLYILLAILLFTIIMVILVPLYASVMFMIKDYPNIVITRETAMLTGGLLGSIFGQIGAIILSYWYMNAVAQVYRYTISKMDNTES